MEGVRRFILLLHIPKNLGAFIYIYIYIYYFFILASIFLLLELKLNTFEEERSHDTLKQCPDYIARSRKLISHAHLGPSLPVNCLGHVLFFFCFNPQQSNSPVNQLPWVTDRAEFRCDTRAKPAVSGERRKTSCWRKAAQSLCSSL